MSGKVFDRMDVLNIVDQLLQNDEARIAYQRAERPLQVHPVVLDLSVARLRTDPLELAFPFKSLFVEEASDVYANVQMIVGTRDAHQAPFSMKLNSSFELDYPIQKAYLYWTAQAGKTMTLKAFVDARFRSGSQISVTGGGVSVITGSTLSRAVTTLGAGAAAAILAQDTTRKNATVYNATGADIWVGDSAITNAGATRGVKWPADSIFEWKNTAALYAYSVAGGDVVTISEV